MAAAVLMQRGLPPVFGQLALLLSELSFKFAAAADMAGLAAGTSPPSSGSGGPSTAISVDGAKKLEMRKDMNKRQKSQRAKKTKDKKV